MNALFRVSAAAAITQFSSQRPKVGRDVCQKLIILPVTRINRKAPIHHKLTILKMKHVFWYWKRGQSESYLRNVFEGREARGEVQKVQVVPAKDKQG